MQETKAREPLTTREIHDNSGLTLEQAAKALGGALGQPRTYTAVQKILERGTPYYGTVRALSKVYGIAHGTVERACEESRRLWKLKQAQEKETKKA